MEFVWDGGRHFHGLFSLKSWNAIIYKRSLLQVYIYIYSFHILRISNTSNPEGL